MASKRLQRAYDHRLIHLVHETRDAQAAAGPGVPQSTVAGRSRRGRGAVVTDEGQAETVAEMRRRVALLERHKRRLRRALRVLFVLHRVLKPDLARLRIPADEKQRLLRAIDRTRSVLGLQRVL
jgi:hypothetical protein